MWALDKKNKIPIIILGIILGVGFLISTVTTIPYVDAQESSLNESDDVMQYMAPLRQIRDDGVSPQDVKCNDNKILVFKILVFTILVFFFIKKKLLKVITHGT